MFHQLLTHNQATPKRVYPALTYLPDAFSSLTNMAGMRDLRSKVCYDEERDGEKESVEVEKHG